MPYDSNDTPRGALAAQWSPPRPPILLEREIYQRLPISKRAASNLKVRLLDLLPGNFYDPIQCEMRIAQLDQRPSYEALSYCWGDNKRRFKIQCGDVYLLVTSNLYVGLQHLRLEGARRTLWIDQVCINQGDVKEVNDQVQHMADIYRNADQTVAWLGPKADGSDFFIRSIQQWAAGEFSTDTTRSAGNAILSTFLNYLDIKIGSEQRTLFSMGKFLSRDWFQRTWIIQETVLAKNVSLLCGQSHITWKTFVQWLYFSDEAGIFSRQEYTHGVIMRIEELRRRKNTFVSLRVVLQNFHLSRATDARDKVYGLYGLATICSHVAEDLKAMNVSPDYRLTAENLYQTVAFGILLLEKNLDLFSAFRGKLSSKIRLASWARDWNSMDLDFACIDPAPYSASDKSICAPQLVDRTLYLRGQLYDTIQTQTEPQNGLSGYQSIALTNQPLMLQSKGAAQDGSGIAVSRDQFFQVLFQVIYHMQVSYQYDTLALSTNDTNDKKTYLFTLFNAPPSTYSECLASRSKIFDSWYRVRRTDRFLFRAFNNAPRWLLRFVITIWWTLRLIQFFIPSQRQQFWECVEFQTKFGAYTPGRRLARTAKGHLALVSTDARVGDTVAIVEGGKVPLVIRPSSETAGTWQLIGDSYVHGIIGGEAWYKDMCGIIALK